MIIVNAKELKKCDKHISIYLSGDDVLAIMNGKALIDNGIVCNISIQHREGINGVKKL